MTDQELKDVLISNANEWPSLAGYAASRNVDAVTLIKNNNGFLPFDIVDADRDGLISYSEWKDKGHPICHERFNDALPEKFYSNKQEIFSTEEKASTYKTYSLELIWHLTTDSTSDLINSTQYNTVLSNLNSLVAFNEDRSATYKGNNPTKSAAVDLFNAKVRALFS
jgi:hypothetical protein